MVHCHASPTLCFETVEGAELRAWAQRETHAAICGFRNHTLYCQYTCRAKALVGHYVTNSSIKLCNQCGKTLYTPTTQQNYSPEATLENYSKRGESKCIALQTICSPLRGWALGVKPMWPFVVSASLPIQSNNCRAKTFTLPLWNQHIELIPQSRLRTFYSPTVQRVLYQKLLWRISFKRLADQWHYEVPKTKPNHFF